MSYTSTAGLATKKWGPHAWYFLFSTIMGSYPVTYDPLNLEHREIKTHFLNLFKSLEFVMPCVFCRRSFKQFMVELPIEPFTNGRINMMKWLYLMKDKVNRKLLKQEKDCYNNEKKRLQMLYFKGQMTKDEYYNAVKEFKDKTFSTTPSPPFEKVLQQYESIRAVCSEKSKTCALPPQGRTKNKTKQ